MARRKTRNTLKRNNSPAIILGSAIIASACLIAFSRPERTQVVASQEASQIVVGQFDTISLPVPAEPIPAGARLADISFKLLRYPKHQVPAGALTDVSPYLNAVAIAPLPANLPMFKSNLSLTASASNPVIDKIPTGMRAITVRVDATAAVEGWAAAGAIVDVLLVTRERSSVVAEQVKILSAERNTTSSAGQSPAIPSTVTLLVSQEQALAINTATNNGKIAFALRSLQDQDAWGPVAFESERLNRRSSTGKADISGYISVGQGPAFTLLDGKWVETTVKPEGFFPGSQD